MKQLFSKLFWGGALIGALLLCAAAYYWKYPDVREMVDGKFPIVKQCRVKITALFQPASAKPWPGMAPASASAPQAAPTAAPQAAAATSLPSEALPAAPAVVQAVATPIPGPVTLGDLNRSRANWPKDVTLKKTIDFPAVMDGKVVGSVKAIAGTEVQLVEIKNGKAGVEFQGGGALVDAADTDLLERAQAIRNTSASK
jgi:hypothetical protein